MLYWFSVADGLCQKCCPERGSVGSLSTLLEGAAVLELTEGYWFALLIKQLL